MMTLDRIERDQVLDPQDLEAFLTLRRQRARAGQYGSDPFRAFQASAVRAVVDSAEDLRVWGEPGVYIFYWDVYHIEDLGPDAPAYNGRSGRFMLTLCNSCYRRDDLESLERILFLDWVVSEQDKELIERHKTASLKDLETWSLEALSSWLQWNDPNGCYSDEDCDGEGLDRLTRAAALECVRNQLGEDED